MPFAFALTAIALALFSQTAFAAPPSTEATDIASKFPVFDFGSIQAHPNVTLAQGGIHVDAAQQEFPATLLLCPTASCISCFRFDLSATTTNECFAAGFDFASFSIDQPSNEGLSFGVFVGPPGCLSFFQIPEVNACFNVVNGTFADYSRT
ncbi:hypothetical protein C8Q70DRAFT_918529 [Cubamyces menziesii]|uniref:Uncharacterized protein n=1 Tax=Trametes cubensis TaxID=1111947 RepID=A0AAD7XAX9_9APHY|nr:hypothetical protein C8Q70DRAFT_918529 [Cubamyces menziesii]KAJ8472745.1 hypothetical protein ONZ51_g8301 [Trametes cubensis]